MVGLLSHSNSILTLISCNFVMADVNKYVSALVVAFTQKNGKLFAQEIALPFVGGAKRLNRLHTQLAESIKRTTNVKNVCMSLIHDVNLSLVISHRILALAAICLNDYPTGSLNCLFT